MVSIKIIKIDAKTNEREEGKFPILGLNSGNIMELDSEKNKVYLTPEDLFNIELKLNEIPYMRFHIEVE